MTIDPSNVGGATPTMFLRFVIRRTLHPSSERRILQQKWLDGYGNPFWVDVPIEDESDV